MEILVTGATGFVGGHVASFYFERGDDLRLLVRPTSDLDRLPESIRRARRAGSTRVSLFEGDLTRPETLRGICDSVDAVVHCACAVKGTFDESREASAIFERVNVEGTRNLAREAIESDVRFVHLSSTAAMGPVTDYPVDESTDCIPEAPYQISKREAELALLELHRRDGLDVVMLRPCLILGPGKEGGEPLELFQLVKRGVFPRIGGELDQTKPLVDVRDVVEATRLAIANGQSGEIYLIHSDGNHTLDEILEVTRSLVGGRRTGIPIPILPVRAAAHGFETLGRVLPWFDPPITPGRLDLFLADRTISIDKARRELGFEPRHQDLYDMLGRTYVGYVRDGQLNAA